jgi:hypothetical protein
MLLQLSPAAWALTRDYEGTLGNKSIGMTLDVEKPYYFYNDFLKNIALQESKDEKGNMVLFELDSKGAKVAVFKCQFPVKDPDGRLKGKLDKEVIIGTWSHLDGSGSLPFKLREVGGVGNDGEKRYEVAGVDNDAAFETGVQKWRKAVITNDRKTVVSMIQFPIEVKVFHKPRVELHNAAQLLKNYDGVFTPSYIKLIRAAVPHNMFVKSSGIMLGESGEVWFDATGKVVALNN